jgi:hypothetical protein
MKPRLRDALYFAPVPEGAFLLGHRGPVSFTGASIYAWVTRLAPHLDGQSTLEELTAGQPPERAAMVRRVVTALREQGLIVDADADRPHELTPAEAERFAAELSVIGAFSDAAAIGLRRYLDSRILVVGAGHGVAALAEALLRSGARQVRVAAAHAPTDATERERLAEAVRRRDPEQRCEVVDGAGHPPEALVADTDVVLRIADAPASDRRLARACADAGLPVLQAVVCGEEAWLGPVGGDNGPMPWEAAWRRLRDVPAGGKQLTDVTATLVTSRLAQETFRRLTGATATTARPSLIRIDLLTLDSKSHPFLPHPFARAARCATAGEFLETVARLRQAPRLEEEEFSRSVMACIDGRLGVLGEVTERGFAQLPLRVAEVTVAAPAIRSGPVAPLLTLTVAGPDAATTRLRAALRGLAAYCCRLVDPRRLISAKDETPLLTGPADDGSALDMALEDLAAGRLSGRVWGLRLPDGAPCPVDVSAAFPALFHPTSPQSLDEGRDPVPPGVAAGYDWDEAIEAALLDHCLRRTLAEVTTAESPYPELAIDDITPDAIGARYRAMLDTVGETPTVYDVTGSTGVPTLAFCVGARTVAYACARNPADALREGWERVLLAYQSRVHEQPEYAPPPVPPLAPRLRGRRASPPPAPVDADGLVAALRVGGAVPVVIPLDHDPEVSRILPHVVCVVLTHG